jgi:hypothetical protein
MRKNFDKATQDEAKWGIGETSLGEIHLLSLSQKKFLRNKKDVPDDRQLSGSKWFTGCHECGAKDHLKQDCPKLQERDISSKPKSSRKRGHQKGDQSETHCSAGGRNPKAEGEQHGSQEKEVQDGLKEQVCAKGRPWFR